MRARQLIVLESTTFPGFTREVLLPAAERHGLQAATRTSSSPSRPSGSIPGNTQLQHQEHAKVLGGVTPASLKLRAALYGKFIDTVVPVSLDRQPPRW